MAPPWALFISYRRVDSSDVTGRIFDRLVASPGRDRVFKDVDSIPLGTDFRHHVAALIERSDCVLAVIGRQWLDVADSAGRRRLDDPTDLVLIEIEAVLARGVSVIPLLVQGAQMPDPQMLPDTCGRSRFATAWRSAPIPTSIATSTASTSSCARWPRRAPADGGQARWARHARRGTTAP